MLGSSPLSVERGSFHSRNQRALLPGRTRDATHALALEEAPLRLGPSFFRVQIKGLSHHEL